MAILLHFVALALLTAIASCKQVQFALNLTWGVGSPDGNPREMVFMNGQFPGPQLNLTQGDSVQVSVCNFLPVEATVHFHGIEQQDTPWSDGTPGLSQKPIQPGGTYLYKWTATQYGQYWYHGHVAGLVQDGLYGPILIQPSAYEKCPFSTIAGSPSEEQAMRNAEKNANVVMVSDWSKFTSTQYFDAEQKSNLDIYCVDSILVNGKGSVFCPPQSTLNSLLIPGLAMLLQAANQTISDKGCTPMSQGALTQGNFNNTDPNAVPDGLFSGCKTTKDNQAVIEVDPSAGWASLNFVSALSAKAAQVSIDNHKMYIYAVDGVYIQPQLVDTFLMYNGERYSALVKLDQKPGAYTMRFANNIPDQLISGYATLAYSNSPTKISDPNNLSAAAINYGGQTTSNNVKSLVASSIIPFNIPSPSNDVSATYILNMGRFGYNWQWTMNNISTYPLSLEDQSPLLYTSSPSTAGNASLTIRTQNNTWIDIILQSTIAPSNPAQPPHPIHKHGNKGYLIGSGSGTFVWPTVAEAQKATPSNFNIPKASYRDSFTTAAILQTPGWTAFRYHVTNPGAWLLHCHIQTHLMGGMALQILDGIDAWPKSPSEYSNGNGY